MSDPKVGDIVIIQEDALTSYDPNKKRWEIVEITYDFDTLFGSAVWVYKLFDGVTYEWRNPLQVKVVISKTSGV